MHRISDDSHHGPHDPRRPYSMVLRRKFPHPPPNCTGSLPLDMRRATDDWRRAFGEARHIHYLGMRAPPLQIRADLDGVAIVDFGLGLAALLTHLVLEQTMAG